MGHYQDLANRISSKVKDIRQSAPDTMQGFYQMSNAVNGDGALSAKHKELLAMAIGIASRCQGCLAFHAKACVKLGVTRQEFMEMIQVAVYMGGGPSLMTAAEALEAFDEYNQ